MKFNHPCGIEYVLVESARRPPGGFTGNGVPPEHAVHGIYGIGIHVYDQDRMVDFAKDVFFARQVRSPRRATVPGSRSATTSSATGSS